MPEQFTAEELTPEAIHEREFPSVLRHPLLHFREKRALSAEFRSEVGFSEPFHDQSKEPRIMLPATLTRRGLERFAAQRQRAMNTIKGE